MITYLKRRDWGAPVDEIVGLADDKSAITDAHNGAIFFAMDTAVKYMYDEEGTQWCVVEGTEPSP